MVKYHARQTTGIKGVTMLDEKVLLCRVLYIIGEVMGEHRLLLNLNGAQVEVVLGEEAADRVMPVTQVLLTVKNRNRLPAESRENVQLYLDNMPIKGIRLQDSQIAFLTGEGGGKVVSVQEVSRTPTTNKGWRSKNVRRVRYEVRTNRTAVTLVAA